MKFFKYLFIMMISGMQLFSAILMLNSGWQLKGAIEDINATSFNNTCAQYLWKYKSNTWKLYIANGQDYNISQDITYFNNINKGEGFWIFANQNCSVNTQSYIPLTIDMIKNKTFYEVYYVSKEPSIYGSILKQINETNGSDISTYGIKFKEFNVTIEDGKFIQTDTKWLNISQPADTKYVHYLTKIENNNYYFKVLQYKIGNNDPTGIFNLVFFNNKNDSLSYIKSNLEKYDDSFFDNNASFNDLEVIKFFNGNSFNYNYFNQRFNFSNYENENNGYVAENDGVKLFAKANDDGSISKTKLSLRYIPPYINGYATAIQTYDINSTSNERIKLQMNGYNDGTQDVMPAIQILKNKIVYYQWQSKTNSSEQTLDDWTTVLDGMDFSHKEVKLAMWVKNGKIHFYAECDGKIGYKTFDISNYTNNPLDDWHWKQIKVETKNDGKYISVKIKKIYVLR